jgi:hypothetical protein
MPPLSLACFLSFLEAEERVMVSSRVCQGARVAHVVFGGGMTPADSGGVEAEV